MREKPILTIKHPEGGEEGILKVKPKGGRVGDRLRRIGIFSIKTSCIIPKTNTAKAVHLLPPFGVTLSPPRERPCTARAINKALKKGNRLSKKPLHPCGRQSLC